MAAAVGLSRFVQAGPIPAAVLARDLIRSHRVAGFRAGELERAHPPLGLDEDVVRLVTSIGAARGQNA